MEKCYMFISCIVCKCLQMMYDFISKVVTFCSVLSNRKSCMCESSAVFF